MPNFKQYPTNLTASERERFAYLSGDSILSGLCDYQSQTEDLCSVSPHIDEARGCFVGEDFAQPVIDDLRALTKRLRGDNRATLERITQALEDARSEAAGNSEYGREELDKALSLLASYSSRMT